MGAVTLSLDEYFDRMRPWAARLASMPRRRHALLGRDDLMQEGLLALWEIWESHHHLPPDELCRLGTTVMRRRMAGASGMAFRRGEKHATIVNVDDPSVILRGGEPVDELLLRFGLHELERTLSGLDQAVFREVLAPGAKTLEAIRILWKTKRQGRRKWSKIRSLALANALGEPIETVQQAWRNIERCVADLLSQESSESSETSYETGRYMKRDRPFEAVNLAEEDASMDTTATPETDLMPPGMESGEEVSEEKPVKKKTGAAKTPAKAKKAEAAKEKKTEAKTPAKKAAAEKAPAEKAATSAKPKAAKPEKVVKERPKALPKETAVVYLGGSKAEWLKKGAKGVIKAHYGTSTLRYGVKFGDKSTVLGAAFVQKV